LVTHELKNHYNMSCFDNSRLPIVRVIGTSSDMGTSARTHGIGTSGV
jgi:hypothetical protein